MFLPFQPAICLQTVVYAHGENINNYKYVNLNKAGDEHAAADAIAGRLLAGKSQSGTPHMRPFPWVHPICTLHDPRSFEEIQLYVSTCPAGCYLFCGQGKGPDMFPTRWIDLAILLAQPACLNLTVKLRPLLERRAELVGRVADIEKEYGTWYYKSIMAEHRSQAHAWVREVGQLFGQLRPMCAWRAPFRDWPMSMLQKSWTEGFVPPKVREEIYC